MSLLLQINKCTPQGGPTSQAYLPVLYPEMTQQYLDWRIIGKVGKAKTVNNWQYENLVYDITSSDNVVQKGFFNVQI
jgi:hypothetical protein